MPSLLPRALPIALHLLCACTPDEPELGWIIVRDELPFALMSVWGTSARDVWAVGADTGAGPAVLHWDGGAWTQLDTGARGDLWWVFGFAGGPVFMGGQDGLILRWQDGTFTPQSTPGGGTVFGLWGASPAELWAVGGSSGGSGGAFAWRLTGETWSAEPEFPASELQDKALWKIIGRDASDVWLVGTGGVTVHYDGAAFSVENVGGGESLFTVHYDAGRFVAVGGFVTGVVVERGAGPWVRAEGETLPGLLGVYLRGERGVAVGMFGGVAERRGDGWHEAEGVATSASLHATWIDDDGGEWVVGGQLQTRPLTDGVLAYRGKKPPEEIP